MSKKRVNNHNSRKGTGGKAINPKHHDRDFDLDSSYAEHIDKERCKDNIYWRYQTVTTYDNDGDTIEYSPETLDNYELAVYEEYFRPALNARNEKQVKNRHPNRVQTMDEYRKNLKTCPEESIFTVGNAKNQVSVEDLKAIFEDYIKYHKEHYPNCMILDATMHLDEAGPHIHWRKIWTAHEDGMLVIGQNKALAEMGIERPEPEREESRYNNAKQTYTEQCRAKQIEIAMSYGYDIEEQAQEPSKGGLGLLQYKYRQALEELKALRQNIEKIAQAVNLRPAPKPPEGERPAEWEIYSQSLTLTNKNGKPLRGIKRKNALKREEKRHRATLEPWVVYDHAFEEWLSECENLGSVGVAKEEYERKTEEVEGLRQDYLDKIGALDKREDAVEKGERSLAQRKARFNAEVDEAAEEKVKKYKERAEKAEQKAQRIEDKADDIIYRLNREHDQELADLKDELAQVTAKNRELEEELNPTIHKQRGR